MKNDCQFKGKVLDRIIWDYRSFVKKIHHDETKRQH
jgi:hypothetical protein